MDGKDSGYNSDEIASIGRSFVQSEILTALDEKIQRGYLDTLCPDWERGTVWTVTGATCCGTRYRSPEAPHTGAASRNDS